MTSKARLVRPENIVAAIFLVLALVFPIIFHVVHLGSTFLPMFFPIALLGFLVSPVVAATVGGMAPILSSLLTGMPPLYPPIAPMMVVEGIVLGGVIALLRTYTDWAVYPILISGILLQRGVMAVTVFLAAPLFHLPSVVFSAGMLVSGIPGIILQLIAIPPLVRYFEPRMQLLQDVH